jgi:2-keto-4-pentenoate hydratase
MGADLPPQAAPFSPAAVSGAIAALVPAIEIVDSRYQDWTKVGGPALVADQGATGHWVMGNERPDWQAFDLPHHKVVLRVNGARVREGSGAQVLGSPLNALSWLANDLAARGRGLREGELVSTGTCIEVYFAHPGDAVSADFGPLGRVSVNFSRR